VKYFQLVLTGLMLAPLALVLLCMRRYSPRSRLGQLPLWPD